MEMINDCKQFPIQSEYINKIHYPECTIPWWLAELAYKDYSKRYGTSQSLERLAERGGFGRLELVEHLKAGNKWPV